MYITYKSLIGHNYSFIMSKFLKMKLHFTKYFFWWSICSCPFLNLVVYLLISIYSLCIMESSPFWDKYIVDTFLKSVVWFLFSYQCLWWTKHLILVKINLSIFSFIYSDILSYKIRFPCNEVNKVVSCFLKKAYTFTFYVYVYDSSQIFVYVVR